MALGDDRIGDQRHVRQLMFQFRHCARHVIVRGDDDQRMEAAHARPPSRLHRIADRVGGRTVDVDATAENRAVTRRQPRYFFQPGRWIDAGDQQTLAAPGSKQVDRVGNALRSAGQHDDAVGGTGIFRSHVLHPHDEPDKAGNDQDQAGAHGRKYQPPHPHRRSCRAARRSRFGKLRRGSLVWFDSRHVGSIAQISAMRWQVLRAVRAILALDWDRRGILNGGSI